MFVLFQQFKVKLKKLRYVKFKVIEFEAMNSGSEHTNPPPVPNEDDEIVLRSNCSETDPLEQENRKD